MLTRLDVSERYIEVMKGIGVEVSSQKTHRSKYFFEFAKRYFHRSESHMKFNEITPFPISALKTMSKRSYLFTQLLMELEGKAWITTSIPSAVRDYLPKVKSISRKLFLEKVFNQANVCELITKVMKGTLPASRAINAIVRQEGFQCGELSDKVSDMILSHTLRHMFIATNPDFNRKGVNVSQDMEILWKEFP